MYYALHDEISLRTRNNLLIISQNFPLTFDVKIFVKVKDLHLTGFEPAQFYNIFTLLVVHLDELVGPLKSNISPK